MVYSWPVSRQVLVKCSSSARQVLVKCSSSARQVLVKCSSSARQVLVKCSSSARQVLVKCSSSARQVLVKCSSSARQVLVKCSSSAQKMRLYSTNRYEITTTLLSFISIFNHSKVVITNIEQSNSTSNQSSSALSMDTRNISRHNR